MTSGEVFENCSSEITKFKPALDMASIDKITGSDIPEANKQELLNRIYELSGFVETFEQEYAHLVVNHAYYPTFRQNLAAFSPTPLPEPAPKQKKPEVQMTDQTVAVSTSKPSAIRHITEDNDRLHADLERAEQEARRIQREQAAARPGITQGADQDLKEKTRLALMQQEEEERRKQAILDEKARQQQSQNDRQRGQNDSAQIQAQRQKEMQQRQEQEARDLAARQQQLREARERDAREALEREKREREQELRDLEERKRNAQKIKIELEPHVPPTNHKPNDARPGFEDEDDVKGFDYEDDPLPQASFNNSATHPTYPHIPQPANYKPVSIARESPLQQNPPQGRAF